MDKIIIIFSLFILSPLTNAQSYDDNFCDDLTFGSDETLYELNRLENIFNIAPKKLLFDDEYDNFTAETIKMYRYINEKNTLFELYSCAALERYKFAKKLILNMRLILALTVLFSILGSRAAVLNEFMLPLVSMMSLFLVLLN